MRVSNKKSERSWAADDLTIFADPIHQYIPVTIPLRYKEYAEVNIIDSVWFQRLRSIGQLQMIKWVYPTAEHSRFMHCLGSMHIASRFVNKLYDSLKKGCRKIKSRECVEETLRLAALLHDIGHGPFSHFFDHNYLNKLGVTHEDIGSKIIITKLGRIIERIRRSPSGRFRSNEKVDPKDIIYLIKKGADGEDRSDWVRALKPLMTGIFTVDSLDFVLRDSYFTGLAVVPADIERLVFYCSFRSVKGQCRLCIHEHGLQALDVFLYTKAVLFKCVYFHRTVRALEIHLKKVLRKTIDYYLTKKLGIKSSLKNRKSGKQFSIKDLIKIYPILTDTALVEFMKFLIYNVDKQKKSKTISSFLNKGKDNWKAIIERDPKWKEIFFHTEEFAELKSGTSIINEDDFKKKLVKKLECQKRTKLNYEIDVSRYDPRPDELDQLSPDERIYVIKNTRGKPSEVLLKRLLDRFPLRIQFYRVFAPKGQKETANKIIESAAKEIFTPNLSDREPTSI